MCVNSYDLDHSCVDHDEFVWHLQVQALRQRQLDLVANLKKAQEEVVTALLTFTAGYLLTSFRWLPVPARSSQARSGSAAVPAEQRYCNDLCEAGCGGRTVLIVLRSLRCAPYELMVSALDVAVGAELHVLAQPEKGSAAQQHHDEAQHHHTHIFGQVDFKVSATSMCDWTLAGLV
mgnify:CR=1 FL=1